MGALLYAIPNFTIISHLKTFSDESYAIGRKIFSARMLKVTFFILTLETGIVSPVAD